MTFVAYFTCMYEQGLTNWLASRLIVSRLMASRLMASRLMPSRLMPSRLILQSQMLVGSTTVLLIVTLMSKYQENIFQELFPPVCFVLSLKKIFD